MIHYLFSEESHLMFMLSFNKATKVAMHWNPIKLYSFSSHKKREPPHLSFLQHLYQLTTFDNLGVHHFTFLFTQSHILFVKHLGYFCIDIISTLNQRLLQVMFPVYFNGHIFSAVLLGLRSSKIKKCLGTLDLFSAFKIG